MEKRLKFFNKSKRKSAYKESEQLDSSSLSSTFKQLTLDLKIINNEVIYTEIRRVLKTIVSGFSIYLVDDVCDTFQKMFSDSDIATRMKLGRTKATYLANFGILPYILMLLHDNINKPPGYTLSFDESCNKVTQECEMGLIKHFWDDDNMVKVRYLGSSFFGHCTAKDLMAQFEEVINKLGPEKLYQVSMDGPK